MTVSTALPAKGPLAIPSFRALLAGGGLSQLGDVCFMVALPWLVLQITGSSLALGGILTALAIPRAALMLFGGAVSDRVSPRNILLAANCVLALSVACVGVLAMHHLPALWVLYLIAICFGVADAFANPAFKVLLPQVVGREHVQSANSLSQSTTQICLLGGAPVAGLLIAKFGMVPVFFIDAASYVFLIAALLSISQTGKPAAAASNVWKSITDGLLYVKNDAGLSSLVMLLACVNFCMIGATQVGLAAAAHFRYASATDFGLMTAAAAIGSLAGIMLAGIWRHEFAFRSTVLCACGVLGIFLLSLALALPIGLMLGSLVLAGIVAGYVNIYVLSALQKHVDAHMLGRAMSVLAFASVGLSPLSTAISGYLAGAQPQMLFVYAGTALLAVTGLFAARRWDFPR